MPTWTANLVKIDFDVPLRLWTGQGALAYDVDSDGVAEIWSGAGALLQVSELEIGEPDRRLTVQLSAIPASLRADFLQDRGPKKATVWWIFSLDGGASWNRAPLKSIGQLSSPLMQDGVLGVEVETIRGDVDHGTVRQWSHEDQQRRFPDDKGFEDLRELAQQGVDTTWPP